MGNMIAKCFNGIFLAKMKHILSLTVVENVEFFCQLFTLWCRVDWKLSVRMDRPGTFLREFLVLIAVTKNGRIIWQKVPLLLPAAKTSLLLLYKYTCDCFLYIHAVLSSAPASWRREWNPLQNWPNAITAPFRTPVWGNWQVECVLLTKESETRFAPIEHFLGGFIGIPKL